MKKMILVIGLLVSMVAGLSAEVLKISKIYEIDGESQQRYYSTGLAKEVAVADFGMSVEEEINHFLNGDYEFVASYTFDMNQEIDESETFDKIIYDQRVFDFNYLFSITNYFEHWSDGTVEVFYLKDDGNVRKVVFRYR